MNTTLFIGLSAAFFTTFSFAPQTIKMLKTRNTEGISVIMYVMYLTGVTFWIVYGYQKSDIAVLIANLVTFVLAAPILFMKIFFRTKKN